MDRVIHAHGADIPVVGFGTWPLKDAECVAAVKAALETGYRHLDTAARYANEAAVGEGLRASGVPREEVFVVTKVWPTDLADGAFQASVEKSLSLLGVDAVDLLLVHWPHPRVSMADTMRPLNEVKRRGRARHIGVSNFSRQQLADAWAATAEPLVANQCEYHPYLDQRDLIAAGREHGMAFVSYAPLGRRQVLDEPVIHDIAARLGRTPAQIVLRWHIQQPDVAAIPKSGRPARIQQNFEVFDFKLEEADMQAISGLANSEGRLVGTPPALQS